MACPGFLHEGFPLDLSSYHAWHLESVVVCIARLLVTLCFLGLLPPPQGGMLAHLRVGFENKPLKLDGYIHP